MPRLPFVCSTDQTAICRALGEIRDELEIEVGFSADVLADAAASAARGPEIPAGSADSTVVDRTSIEFVTVDPPGSMDLDQAYAGEPTSSGYRVFYAIADVAGWIRPGDSIDAESRDRGLTMYSPDVRAPLHPPELSEGAASLLPGSDRQALLWTIDLDDGGNLVDAELERATVRSRAKLTYREASALIDSGESPVLDSLREIGLRRQALEVERGAVSLRLAQQEVTSSDGGFELFYDESLPVEGWNAQISLLAGIAGAGLMLDGKVGLLRTLPRPDDDTIRELRRTARALGIEWPKSADYASVVRNLDPNEPRQAALISQSARGLRGAGYLAFEGVAPEDAEHSAIASTYAHVTAPLRRLGDRYANECVLAACRGATPPDWVLETLPDLPAILGRARSKEGSLDRQVVDLLEAALLTGRDGEEFDGLVTDVDESKERVKVQIGEPAVVAYANGTARLGEVARVKLIEASVPKRLVRFELIESG